jgi:hypothetical protein
LRDRIRNSIPLWASVIVANIGSYHAASADTLRFLPQQTFDSGSGASNVTATDINGDGRLDLVVANSNASSISVLLNTSVPGSAVVTFATRVAFDTGSSPNSLSAADVNGDGVPDLIVANYVDDTVSVLLNTTAPGATVPSFASQQVFGVGTYPASVAMADVNGDGRSDIIVANYIDSTLSVLMNLTAPGASTSTFAEQKVFATEANPSSVTCADVNADGRPDLVTANLYGDSVSVLINTATPGTMELGFAPQQAFASGRYPNGVAASDFNDDGLPDLVVANYYADTVSVLLNATSPGDEIPTFAPRQVFTAGHAPYAVAAADVSLDGLPDVIVANSLEDTVSVLVDTTVIGKPILDFAEQERFGTAAIPIALAAADVNGDGDLDLISANYGGTISVLVNATHREDGIFANGFERSM